jgi:serine/threonine protein kinase
VINFFVGLQTLASFDHPHIVKLREVVRTPEEFCIVTEVSVGSLDKF